MIIDKRAREAMKKILRDVQSGAFAKEWVAESQRGIQKLKKMREEAKGHLIEKVGKDLRKWAGIEK
jgi:ketol-acid reductoisomerase